MEQKVIKEFNWKEMLQECRFSIFVVVIATLYLVFASYKTFTADFTWFRVFAMGFESILLGINLSIIYKSWDKFYHYIYKINYKDMSPENGRVYEKKHFENLRMPMLGQLGHPDSPDILLNNVTHKIQKVVPKEEHMYLDLQFVRVNPIPPELLRQCKLSPIGVGSRDLKTYKLFSFDFIPK